MLLVEGALAKVQGGQGIIPEIQRRRDPPRHAGGSDRPGRSGCCNGRKRVPVPGLIAAFREAMNAPEHAQYVHWGATSQDIIDTGLMLRLRQMLKLAEGDLRSIISALADQAERHAETPMVARTYGQHATPTSWGAVCADWGHALTDALEALPALREGALWVSLSGAAGTASELGPDPSAIRALLAEALDLGDPGRSWHVDRGPLQRIADWLAGVTATLGRMSATLIALSASETGEVRLAAAGASSTMPQKQNPVGPSAVLALNHQMTGLRAALRPGETHSHQRDGAAWFTEWLVLPQLCLTAMSALQQSRALTQGLAPDPARMLATLQAGQGLVHAEALSFALARTMPRPDAQAAVKTLCREVAQSGTALPALARAAHPDLPPDLFDPGSQMGEAPAEARRFVTRARSL